MRAICCVGAALLLAGCGEMTAPFPASITVQVNVIGNGTDADGFILQLGVQRIPTMPNAPTTFAKLSPGTYTFELLDVAPQCTSSQTLQSVSVAPRQTATVQFEVACVGGIAFNADMGSGPRVVYLGEDGRTVQLSNGPGRDFLEDWSPDGSHIVYHNEQNSNADLYTVRTDGSDLRQLTSHPYDDLQARWSPDGKSIVFHRRNTRFSSQSTLHIVNADGTGEHEVLPLSNVDFDPTWVANGDTIVFSCDRFGSAWDLCAVTPEGSGLRKILTMNGAQHTEASRDGKYLAFQAFPGGQAVWVAAVSGENPVRLTPAITSSDFGWSPDASQLVVGTSSGGPTVYQYGLQRVNRDGTGLTPLTDATVNAAEGRWSADATWIVYYVTASATEQELWMMRPDGSENHQITGGPGQKFRPRWNPQARPGL
jgi:TolB protein